MIKLLLLAFIASVGAESFYDVLGVDSQASKREIITAWRSFVFKNHPEVNTEDADVYSKFVRTAAIFNILNDEASRLTYDTHGESEVTLDLNVEIQSLEEYQRYQEFAGTKEIILLDTATWADFFTNTDPMLILITANGVPQADKLAKAWKILAIETYDWLRVAVVNCDDPGSMYLCDQFGALHLPVIEGMALGDVKNGPKSIKFYMDHSLRNYRQFAKNTIPSLLPQNVHNEFSRPTVLQLAPKDFNFDTTNFHAKVAFKKRWVLNLCVSAGVDSCTSQGYQTRKVAAMAGRSMEVGQVSCRTYTAFCKSRFGVDIIPSTISISEQQDQMIKDKTVWFTLDGLDDKHPVKIDSKNGEVVFYEAWKRMPPLIPTTVEELKLAGVNAMRDTGEDVLHYDSKSTSLSRLGLEEEKFELLVAFYSEKDPWCTAPPAIKRNQRYNECDRAKRALQRVDIEHVNTWGAYPIHLRSFDCTQDAESEQVCQTLNVNQKDGRMRLMLLRNKALNPVWYHGAFDRSDSIRQFLHLNFDSDIHEIVAGDFDRFVRREKQNWFIMFSAPWCNECSKMIHELKVLEDDRLFNNIIAKKFEKVGKAYLAEATGEGFHNVDTTVHPAKMDCEANAELCHELGIVNYPTFLFFHAGVRHQFDYDHLVASEFVRFIKNQWNPIVHELTVAEFMEEVESPSRPATTAEDVEEVDDIGWVVYFFTTSSCADCEKVANTVEAAARALNGVLKFAKMNCELEASFCKSIGVTEYPTLKKYDVKDPNNHHVVSFPNVAKSTPVDILKVALKDVTDHVHKFSAMKEFQSKVLSEDDLTTVWFVFFHHDDKCASCDELQLQIRALASRWEAHEKELQAQSEVAMAKVFEQLYKRDPEIKKYHEENPEIAEAALKTGGIQVKVGSVDCKNKAMATTCLKQRVKRFPTLIYYSKYRKGNYRYTKGLNEALHTNMVSMLQFVADQEEADRQVWRSPSVHGIGQEKAYRYKYLDDHKMKFRQHDEL